VVVDLISLVDGGIRGYVDYPGLSPRPVCLGWPMLSQGSTSALGMSHRMLLISGVFLPGSWSRPIIQHSVKETPSHLGAMLVCMGNRKYYLIESLAHDNDEDLHRLH
jgi:hypothetical protein